MIFLSLIAGYLIGSIPFGYVVARAKGIDIRQRGSGNIGATNVWRSVGPGYGLVVLVLDALKGAAAVFLGKWAGADGIELLTGLAALLGHAFPVFLRFKGGKIIAAGLGVLIALAPPVSVVAVLTFVVVVFLSRYISLGSVCAALSVPVMLAALNYNRYYIAFGVMVCVLAILKHIPNIRRIMNGSESRFKFK